MTHLRDTVQPHTKPELERALLPRWLQPARLHHEQTQALADAIVATGEGIEADTQLWSMRQDPRHEMRCVPVMARGITAVIPDTDPLAALIARQPRDE